MFQVSIGHFKNTTTSQDVLEAQVSYIYIYIYVFFLLPSLGYSWPNALQSSILLQCFSWYACLKAISVSMQHPMFI